MSSSHEKLVDEYLRRLRAELSDLPRARRQEIEQEVSEHIAEARAEVDAQSEAELRTLLDRVGDPSEIAAEARDRFGIRPRRRGWIEVAAVILLPVGGVIIPIVGWFVGVALLWMSEVWNTRDKLIGTLVIPGGLLVPMFLTTHGIYAETCAGEYDARGNVISETCTGGPSQTMEILGAILVGASLIAPLAAAVYLGWRIHRPQVAS